MQSLLLYLLLVLPLDVGEFLLPSGTIISNECNSKAHFRQYLKYSLSEVLLMESADEFGKLVEVKHVFFCFFCITCRGSYES